MKSLWLLSMLLTGAQALTGSNQAFGGWTSGGGELVRDARNPWFLPNVTTVKYCIRIDESNFGETTADVQSAIRTSFDFWKAQFQTANSVVVPPFGKLVLAQHAYQEVLCQEDHDITFQFGELDGDQFQFLQNPKRYIGITVRTDYDTKQLRGKGFVYISPQAGPLALDLKGLVSSPWSRFQKTLLIPTLIHETGHIFGLIHSNDTILMTETFPERLLQKGTNDSGQEAWQQFILGGFLNSLGVFKFNAGLTEFLPNQMISCRSDGQPSPPIQNPTPTPTVTSNSVANQNLTARLPLVLQLRTKMRSINSPEILWNRFFGIPWAAKCSSVHLVSDALIFQIGDSPQTMKELGRAPLTRTESTFNIRPMVNIWLPEDQNVFTGIRSDRITAAYMYTQSFFSGTYSTADGSLSRPISIAASPSVDLTYSGLIDGQIVPDLQAATWSVLKKK